MKLPKYQDVVRDRRGRAVSGASVRVYYANTGSTVTVYADAGAAVTRAQPVSTDANGRFWFYAPSGVFDITVSRSGIDDYTLEDVTVWSSFADTLNVAAFGALPDDALDDTEAIQDAINHAGAGGGAVVLITLPGTYILKDAENGMTSTTTDTACALLIGSPSDTLVGRHDNVTLSFGPGVTLSLQKDPYTAGNSSYHGIIRIQNAQNIKILGSGTTVTRDTSIASWDSPINEREEHVIQIFGSKDVEISGLILSYADGDGIFLSEANSDTVCYRPTRINIHDCEIHTNSRHGVTVLCADNVTLERLWIYNHDWRDHDDGWGGSGTGVWAGGGNGDGNGAPEPQSVFDLKVLNVNTNLNFRGFAVFPEGNNVIADSTGNKQFVYADFTDCKSYQDRLGFLVYGLQKAYFGRYGAVSFTGCVAEEDSTTGFTVSGTSAPVRFTNCTAVNSNRSSASDVRNGVGFAVIVDQAFRDKLNTSGYTVYEDAVVGPVYFAGCTAIDTLASPEMLYGSAYFASVHQDSFVTSGPIELQNITIDIIGVNPVYQRHWLGHALTSVAYFRRFNGTTVNPSDSNIVPLWAGEEIIIDGNFFKAVGSDTSTWVRINN